MGRNLKIQYSASLRGVETGLGQRTGATEIDQTGTRQANQGKRITQARGNQRAQDVRKNTGGARETAG